MDIRWCDENARPAVLAADRPARQQIAPTSHQRRERGQAQAASRAAGRRRAASASAPLTRSSSSSSVGQRRSASAASEAATSLPPGEPLGRDDCDHAARPRRALPVRAVAASLALAPARSAHRYRRRRVRAAREGAARSRQCRARRLPWRSGRRTRVRSAGGHASAAGHKSERQGREVLVTAGRRWRRCAPRAQGARRRLRHCRRQRRRARRRTARLRPAAPRAVSVRAEAAVCRRIAHGALTGRDRRASTAAAFAQQVELAGLVGERERARDRRIGERDGDRDRLALRR